MYACAVSHQKQPMTISAQEHSPTGIPTRLAKNTVLFGLAGAIGKALALITVPLLTRLLEPSAYGLADLATSMAALLTVFAMFAGDLPTARAYALADPNERPRVLASYLLAILAVSASVALVALPASGLIASAWSAPDESGLARLAILLVPISALQAAAVTTLRLVDRPVAFATLSTFDLVAQLGLALLLAMLGWGPFGIVLGFVLGSLAGLAAAGAASFRHWSAPPIASRALGLVGTGMYYLPGTTLFIFADYISRSIVATDAGQAAVGHLGVAFRLASVMALATAAFSLAWGPMGMGQRPGALTARLFGRVLQLLTIGLLGLALVGGAFGPELATLVASSPYREAAHALPGLLAGSALGATFFILTVAAGVSERAPVVAAAAVGGALVQIAVSAALVNVLGLAGIGIAAVAGHVVSVAIMVPAVRPAVTGLRWTFVAIVAIACIAAVMLGILNQRDAPLTLRAVIAVIAAAIGGWLITRALREPVTAIGPKGAT